MPTKRDAVKGPGIAARFLCWLIGHDFATTDGRLDVTCSRCETFFEGEP